MNNRLMPYNWQQPDWPGFSYEIKHLDPLLIQYAQLTGRLSGHLDGLPPELKNDTLIEFMVNEALKSAKIEGEQLAFEDVHSSIRNQLGLNAHKTLVQDNRAQGIAQMMLNLTDTIPEPLSENMLFEWHRMLFLGQEKNRRLEIGQWRQHEDSMQIVSGAYGKWTVHFEAPPSARVSVEMQGFIKWFNATGPKGSHPIIHAPIRSAIAHLYFESIHPFEDGNGRIGRAVAEKALLQQSPFINVLNLSTAIEAKKSAYYEALKKGQRRNQITPWLEYFVKTLLTAQKMAESTVIFIINKSIFRKKALTLVSERQLKVIDRLLKEGPAGFAGGLTAKKYETIGQCSKATATRELADLLEKGFLLKLPGGGRNTAYQLNLASPESPVSSA